MRCVAAGESIQAAVDTAGGGVIQVAAGEYAENLVLTSGTRLRGGFAEDFASRPADAVTTVVGQGGAPTIVMEDVEDVEVEGLSITGGTGMCFEGTPTCDGGGIYAARGTGLVIASNRIFDNVLTAERDSNGGGLSLEGDGEIVGNVIEGNLGGNGAGVIAAGQVRFAGNVVRNNNANAGDHGGGAFFAGELVIEDNLFEGNTVGVTPGYGWGGGMIIVPEGTTFATRNNTYRGNFAESAGAGAFVDEGADGSMTNELIVGNSCSPTDPRGALFVDAADDSGTTGSVVEVVNATIADNDCGFGIAVENVGSRATVRNSIIADNGGPALLEAGEGSSASATYTLADEALPGTGNITGDPAFAGGGDYHLRSTAGRFDPATGTFVQDADTSAGVDAGDPADPVGEETDPNGGRVNLGAYGGTAEASRSGEGGTPSAVSVHAGAGRIQTAVAVSADSFPAAGSASAAVLARENDFADALSGAALAVVVDGPLLLSHTGELTPDTAAELQRVLAPGATVHLLGGAAALGATVEAAVGDLGFTPDRHAGATRFETAVAIADAVEAAAGVAGTVLLADGGTFPAALVAGADARVVAGVLLLTSGSTAHAATRAWLDQRAGTPQLAVGAAAIAAHPAADPAGTADPYATAAELATRLVAAPAAVGLASGVAFPDALAGGAYSGRLGVPLLLTAPDSLPEPTRAVLAGTASITAAHVYGGGSAIAPGVRAEVQSILVG